MPDIPVFLSFFAHHLNDLPITRGWIWTNNKVKSILSYPFMYRDTTVSFLFLIYIDFQNKKNKILIFELLRIINPYLTAK